MQLYPIRLEGVTKSPIWGGTRLCREYGKKSDCATVGESWELTVRREEISCVQNGEYAGEGLDALIDRFGDTLTGGDFGSSNFPLLIKLIDASDRLSVQVHPDDSYAAKVENDRGKTEMWYIVDAEPDAEIICGLADGVDSKGFADAVAAGDISRALKHQPVKAGETYFIPAGLAHAIGKGVLIAEIQQNCDLTYRVYDYDRRDAAGNLRELHVKKALDVTRPFTDAEIDAIRYECASQKDRDNADLLAACAYFRVERLQLQEGVSRDISGNGVMRHVLILSDGLEIVCGNERYETSKGESWLIPASLEGAFLKGAGVAIVSTVK